MFLSQILTTFASVSCWFEFLGPSCDRVVRLTNFAGEKLSFVHLLGVLGRDALSKWWDDTLFRELSHPYFFRLLMRSISFSNVLMVNNFWFFKYSSRVDNTLSSVAFCFFTKSELFWFSWYFFAKSCRLRLSSPRLREVIVRRTVGRVNVVNMECLRLWARQVRVPCYMYWPTNACVNMIPSQSSRPLSLSFE